MTEESFSSNGTCIFFCSNGDRYDGDWVNDQRQGHGQLRATDGTQYNVSSSFPNKLMDIRYEPILYTCFDITDHNRQFHSISRVWFINLKILVSFLMLYYVRVKGNLCVCYMHARLLIIQFHH